MDDVIGVEEVQASGDVRQDLGAVFVPPKLALVIVAQSIFEVPACITSTEQQSAQAFQNVTRSAVMNGAGSLVTTLRMPQLLAKGGTSHKAGL